MAKQLDLDQKTVDIMVGQHCLSGILTIPHEARAIVLFAHGSGSSRLSPRNQFVASVIQQAGIATLLVDLLGEDEATDRAAVFDIELLAERLRAICGWVKHRDESSTMRVGYFGASTGAAAALVAAAHQVQDIGAVVSRGGRPDLAMAQLAHVRAPTLLIVGSLDEEVLELNREAYYRLGGVKELVVVPGATHLFMEPGALEQVAELASRWFQQHLVIGQQSGSKPSRFPR